MAEQISGDDLRRLMRHVPSPVTVLTYSGKDGKRGVTIGSFTSVSLSPPLVSFNIMKGSSTYSELVNPLTRFAIHLLQGNQSHVSERFAIPDLTSEAQFEHISFDLSPEGLPIIKDCIAVLVCAVYDTIVAGDHSIVIGEVLRAISQNEGRPLLYFQRAYHEIGQPV